MRGKIDTYMDLFRGRSDVFARRWTSRRTGRSGYAPVIRPEAFVDGRPPRHPAPADYLPFTRHELLERHIHGPETLGIYPLLTDNTTWFLAFDFDGPAALVEARELMAVCDVQGLPACLEVSRSGNYHLWMFFEVPIAAWKARRVGLELLREAGLEGGGTGGTRAFDRLFPNQDRLSGRGLGNLIALPFQRDGADADRTVFLDPEAGLTPYPNPWDVLPLIVRVTEPRLLEIDLMADVTLTAPTPAAGPRERPSSAVGRAVEAVLESSANGDDSVSVRRLRDVCVFVDHCVRDAAVLPELDWWALASNLAAFGEDGREVFHEFSAGYPHYDPDETDEKFDQAVAAGMPHTCAFIRDRAWNCGRDCGVKSPCALARRKI